jgi:anti-anti-sigma factor
MLIAEGRLVFGQGADWEAWSPRAAAVPGRRVRIDLSAVTEIDAAGVGLLARLAVQARCRGRELAVVAASARVRRVLEVVRLDAALRLPPIRPHQDRPPREPEPVWPPCPDEAALALAAL